MCLVFYNYCWTPPAQSLSGLSPLLSDSILPQPGGPGPRIYIPQGNLGLIAVVMMSTSFWDIILCSLLKVNGRFGGKYCLLVRGRISRTKYKRTSVRQDTRHSVRHLLLHWYLAWLIRPRTRRRYVPPKRRLMYRRSGGMHLEGEVLIVTSCADMPSNVSVHAERLTLRDDRNPVSYFEETGFESRLGDRQFWLRVFVCSLTFPR
jgi:hypothetical protein